jgi:hypothetical protein
LHHFILRSALFYGRLKWIPPTLSVGDPTNDKE